MVNECLDKTFALEFPIKEKTTLSEYGSMVVLQVLKYYENGELDILVECDQNFKINQFEAKDKLYPAGTISTIRENIFNPNEGLKKEVSTYLKALLDKDVSNELNDLLSFKSIINVMNLTDDEKVKFLKYNNDKKNDFLLRKVRFMQILLNQEKQVEQNFYLN